MGQPTFQELVRIGKQLEANRAQQDKDFQLQANVLDAREQEIRNEVRKIFTDDFREQRRQIEQAVDFAIRSMPWYAKFLGTKWIERRSNELLRLVDFQIQQLGTEETIESDGKEAKRIKISAKGQLPTKQPGDQGTGTER